MTYFPPFLHCAEQAACTSRARHLQTWPRTRKNQTPAGHFRRRSNQLDTWRQKGVTQTHTQKPTLSLSFPHPAFRCHLRSFRARGSGRANGGALHGLLLEQRPASLVVVRALRGSVAGCAAAPARRGPRVAQRDGADCAQQQPSKGTGLRKEMDDAGPRAVR